MDGCVQALRFMRAIGNPRGPVRDTGSPVGVASERSLLRALPHAIDQLDGMIWAAAKSPSVAAAMMSSPQA